MKEIRNDQPIDEIRELRRRISARFDHDPARLVAYYTSSAWRHCRCSCMVALAWL